MMKTNLFFFLILFFYSFNASAVIRYVTPSGSGAMTGTTWATAFRGDQLQDAIDASSAGDEVWVRFGTYPASVVADRNEWFSMRNGVAIYGSFNGTETILSQRSFSCGFSSILSGEIGVPGNADNSYHVISNSSLNTTAVLDGFTIRDGHANFDLLGNDNRSLGGGMLNNGPNGGLCTPVIRNCLFTNNTALFGGGIFDHGQNGGNASPVITNCLFTGNTATGGGGAIDNFGYNGNASPVITNCIFYSNTATDRAGAIYCWGGGNGNASPVILNSIFINNSSVDGGAIVSDRLNFVSGSSGTANPTVRNSIFWGNTASGTGPQFILLGGASFTATYSLLDISNQNPPHTITGAGTGNLFVAPSFINIANAIGPDNCWLTSDDGLQLQGTSAGVDAGNNAGVTALDIRGYSRISNGVVDMGAYEFNVTIVPVSLFDFYGISAANKNTLHWKTVSENNNLHFNIERSANGQQFSTIGAVPGAGNSSAVRQYQFNDEQLLSPAYYYRIKQVDGDGRSSLSQVILLTGKKTGGVAVFPNPVKTTVTLVFDHNLANEEFVLFNNEGQRVGKYFVTGNCATMDLSDKIPGLYVLVNNSWNVVTRIIKIAE